MNSVLLVKLTTDYAFMLILTSLNPNYFNIAYPTLKYDINFILEALEISYDPHIIFNSLDKDNLNPDENDKILELLKSLPPPRVQAKQTFGHDIQHAQHASYLGPRHYRIPIAHFNSAQYGHIFGGRIKKNKIKSNKSNKSNKTKKNKKRKKEKN